MAIAGVTNGVAARGGDAGDAGERRAQVALDVDRERLERRDVERRGSGRFAAGAGVNISRSRHQRNAVSVLPLPVGARISVDSPRAIAGQPSVCGRRRVRERRREPFAHGRMKRRERIVSIAVIW